jgi:hypothetical protein
MEVEDGKDVATRCLLQLWCLAKIVRDWEKRLGQQVFGYLETLGYTHLQDLLLCG